MTVISILKWTGNVKIGTFFFSSFFAMHANRKLPEHIVLVKYETFIFTALCRSTQSKKLCFGKLIRNDRWTTLLSRKASLTGELYSMMKVPCPRRWVNLKTQRMLMQLLWLPEKQLSWRVQMKQTLEGMQMVELQLESLQPWKEFLQHNFPLILFRM